MMHDRTPPRDYAPEAYDARQHGGDEPPEDLRPSIGGSLAGGFLLGGGYSLFMGREPLIVLIDAVGTALTALAVALAIRAALRIRGR
jgi:predicted lipid-binding transport protein (Tim44 family)